jgi:hypothetical protein
LPGELHGRHRTATWGNAPGITPGVKKMNGRNGAALQRPAEPVHCTGGGVFLKDIRTLSYELHPPTLIGSGPGLVTAIASVMRKGFSERSGVKIDFVESGKTVATRLPPEPR